MSLSMEDLIVKLYSDPELKRRFLAEPTAVLAEWGITLPAGVSLKVLEDREDLRHIVIPFVNPKEKAGLEVLEPRTSKLFAPP